MSQSNAPGETRKIPNEWARLTIQMDVQFTPQGIAELAPDYDKTGIAALRQLIENAKKDGLKQEDIIEMLSEIMSIAGFAGQVFFDNISAQVGK